MSRIETLLHGGDVLLPDGLHRLDLGMSAGRIAGLYAPGSAPEAGELQDCTGLTILPGLIDIHFHIRAPSYPERGTVASETRAAAAGGVTTLFEMPIAKPCCSNAGELSKRRAHFEKNTHVNFGLYGAPGDLSGSALTAMQAAGAIAFKMFTTSPPPGREDEFDGLAFPGEAEQFRALERVAATGLPLVVHAESADLLSLFGARAASLNPADSATHTASRPAVCEAVAVAKLLAMNITARAKLHIAHVTSAETVAILRGFAGTSDFSAETCPQYLFATEIDVARHGVFAKVNPPIRSQADQHALWAAIEDGVIIHVTTDHAPFSFAEKQASVGNFPAAPPGVPGVEFILPAMLDAVAKGRFTLKKAHDLICANGAKRYGIYPRKGAILPGSDADLVLVDLAAETLLSPERLQTNAREVAQLFVGRPLRGAVKSTWVAGKIVYHNGKVIGLPGQGRHVTPVGQV